MSWDNWKEQEENMHYKVVINPEEQYSIWPSDRENPPLWRDEGTAGTKSECLDHIEKVWTDMRPLSVRKAMEQARAVQHGSGEGDKNGVPKRE
ncbi:MAG: MbtH family NRPS accessory protein [Proteobacteria bacterium]|nr:MbtH family NRPS accessory protein [Pseudomonadota bacterium]